MLTKEELFRVIALITAISAAVFIILALASHFAHSRELYPGQYAQVDPQIRSWFDSVKAPNGVPCCSEADGHKTTWEKRPGDDRYWVPIEGEMVPVPPEAVVRNAGNPLDSAIVWYVPQRNAGRDGRDIFYVRCFVPASDI